MTRLGPSGISHSTSVTPRDTTNRRNGKNGVVCGGRIRGGKSSCVFSLINMVHILGEGVKAAKKYMGRQFLCFPLGGKGRGGDDMGGIFKQGRKLGTVF